MRIASHRFGSLVLVTAGALAALPTLAHAWGCEGHQTVALVAALQLGKNARTHVDKLLANNPIPDPPVGPSRFCASNGLTFFVDSSTWADDIRNTQFDTFHSGNWHFLDIPPNETRDHVEEFCTETGCVTEAISEQIKILKSKAKGKKKADALRFLIHFVGDIHQPLHCATNGDRGGNCVPVFFIAGTEVASTTDAKSGNLHAIWDTNMIRTYLPEGNMNKAARLQKYADQLSEKFADQMPVWKDAGVDVDDWAFESHQLAQSTAYGKLEKPIPVEPDRDVPKSCKVGNDDIRKRMAALHEGVEQSYVDAAQPVIEQQLAKAGTRLALVLNQIWP